MTHLTKKLSLAAALAVASFVGTAAHAQSQAPDAFQHLNSKFAIDYVQAKDKSENALVEKSKGARLTLSAQKDVLGLKDVYFSLQSQVLMGDESAVSGKPGDETYSHNAFDLSTRSFEVRVGKGLRLDRANVLLTPYALAGTRKDELEFYSNKYNFPSMTRDQTFYGLGAMAQVSVAPGLFLTADLNVADSDSVKLSSGEAGSDSTAPSLKSKWHSQASLGLTYFVDKDLSLSAHYKLMQSKYVEDGLGFDEKASHVAFGLAYHF